MNHDLVTLLELRTWPHGKHIAYCTATGAFLVATPAAANVFGVPRAHELFGKHLVHSLDRVNIEALENYIHLHGSHSHAQPNHQSIWKKEPRCPPEVLHIARSGLAVWVQLVSVPVTLRLLRCLDVVQMAQPVYPCIDASSFVIEEAEYGTLMESNQQSPNRPSDFSLCNQPQSIALELKELPTDEDSESDVTSLANFAFEADWIENLQDVLI